MSRMDFIPSSSICCVTWEELLYLTRAPHLVCKKGTMVAPGCGAGREDQEPPLLPCSQWHFLHHRRSSRPKSHSSGCAVIWDFALLSCERWASRGGREEHGKLLEEAASGDHRRGGPRAQLNKRRSTLSLPGVPWPCSPDAALFLFGTRPLLSALSVLERDLGHGHSSCKRVPRKSSEMDVIPLL